MFLFDTTTYHNASIDMTTKRIFRFGMGNDIDIRHECNINRESDVYSLTTYHVPSNHYLNGNIKNFMAKQIEVWTSN